MLKKILVCGFNDELSDILERYKRDGIKIFHEAFNLPGEKESIITKFGTNFSVKNYPILLQKVYNTELPLDTLREELMGILINLSDSDLEELLKTFLIMKIPLIVRAEKISPQLKKRVTLEALYARVNVMFV